jgi:hypothetical protein
MIRSEHMKSCLTAQIHFMLFKGPGSFKINFKIGGNVEKLKAYRLIPFTPPLLFHFTLPLSGVQRLKCTSIFLFCFLENDRKKNGSCVHLPKRTNLC